MAFQVTIVGKKFRQQRAKKWLRDPRCEQCGVVTVLPEIIAKITGVTPNRLKDFPDNMATIDHEHSRFFVEKRLLGGRRRLLCWKCNQERAQQEQSIIPIEELRRRSGSYPRCQPQPQK